MTQQEEKCAKCGKKVRLYKQAATITQWLKTTSDCNCDSQSVLVSPFSQEYVEIIRCDVCGKDRTPSRDGSLTQWIFKDNKCKCEWSERNVDFDPAQPLGAAQATPIDEEIKAMLKSGEINYQGMSEDAFPFERYRIAKEIGRGNAGMVFKCWDLFLKKRVAIKTLHGRVLSPEELLRLQNEARAASKLSHPNVVRVLDFGSSKGGQPYMVMDFVSGQTLQQVLKEQVELDESTALIIFSQVLAGISHAHRHGVLHRDIKPSNILVIDSMSETPQAKVIDFGIASLTHTASVSTTASGKTVMTGSPSYMSPDQARGELFEQTSDIYSLGCVFYETLSGENPFNGDSVLDTINRHATLDLPPFSESAPSRNIDPEVEEIVRKMLEKNPHMRYQSVDEVKDLLDAVIDRKDVERGGASLRRRRPGTLDDEHFLAGKPFGQISTPDAMLYAIIAAGTMFVLSIAILVMNRAADDVLPHKKEPIPKAAGPVKLDNEVTKPNYIEDILMPNSKKNDAYLKALKPGPDLPKEINLRMSDVTDDGIKSLENLPVTFLDLSYTDISDKALEYVSHMPRLSGMYLTGDEITTDGIRYLTKMKTLRFLDLSAIPVSVESMRLAAQIPEINRLYFISSPGVTATNLKELEAAKYLEALAFRRSLLGTSEVVAISKLPRVKTLLISFCGLKDADLTPMQDMPNLELLDISGNDVTDGGMKTLSRFKHLKELYIGHCVKITPEGIAQFKKTNGKCAVRIELGPTMLGSGQL